MECFSILEKHFGAGTFVRKINRVLMATLNVSHPQRGMLDGLEKVFGKGNVRDFDFMAIRKCSDKDEIANEAFIEAVSSFRPDWVWMQVQDSGVLKDWAVHKAREKVPSAVFTHWTGDLRPSVSPYMASFCRATNITFASSVGQLPLFRIAGATRAEYCQIGLDFSEDVLGIPEWTPPFRVPPVVLCGNWYGDLFPGTKDRMEAILALKGAGIDVGVVGSGWPQGIPCVGSSHVKQQSAVWRRTKVALNSNHFNDVEGYYSDRQLIAMASGTPLVCRYIPGLEREFKNWKHCIWYRSQDELVTYVRKLLLDAPLRAKIGAAGREEVIKHHTWEARFSQILPIIEEVGMKR